MAVYQVFISPRGARNPQAESGAVFIPDRFSWGAALLPPVWAMLHGLWLELVIWVAGMIVLGALAPVLGDTAVFWTYVLASVLIGAEAAGIRASNLRRRGYFGGGDIIAGSIDLAEMRWIRSGDAL